MENTLCAFVNTVQEPLEVIHISWYTRTDGQEIVLVEVVRKVFPHPQASEDATVSIMTEIYSDPVKRGSKEAAQLLLLEAALQNIRVDNFKAEEKYGLEEKL